MGKYKGYNLIGLDTSRKGAFDAIDRVYPMIPEGKFKVAIGKLHDNIEAAKTEEEVIDLMNTIEDYDSWPEIGE